MDDRKRALKKFLHDYAVAISTTVLLIVILGLLMIARHNALVSVNDLSKINPLITSEQNELVAANGSSDVVKIAKDDESQTTQPGTTKDNGQSPSPSKGSSGGSTTGSGGGTSPSPSPETPPPFSASIGQMSYNSSTSCLLLICNTTYTIQATIQGQYAPGTVTYQWVEDNSTVAQSSSVSFSQGDTSKTVSFQWTTAKGHTVTLQLTSPNTDKKSVSLE